MDLSARAKDIHKRLKRAIPEPRCELNHDNPWQLLIATILSAQSTDKTVNEVGPKLFARYPDAAALAQAELSEVEALIKPTGFFRNKAKAIVSCSAQLVERHDGQVPRKLEQLVELSGVARKTANLVLGVGYGISGGIVVDTHVSRVAQRLELTAETKQDKVEGDLCELFHKRSWVDISHRLLLHGRYLCTKRNPDCAACPLHERCPSAEGSASGRWTQRADGEALRMP